MKLDALIRKSSFYIQIFLWTHLPLVVWLGYYWDQNSVTVPAFVAGLCLTATWAYRRDPTSLDTAMLSSTALSVIICVLLFMMQGHPWQSDMHMYLFAGLAICTLFYRWQAIVAFTGVVAVHHLALNYLMTAAVFAGPADLERVILHAVILLIEAGALTFFSLMLRRMKDTIEVAFETVIQERRTAENLMTEADAKRISLAELVRNLSEKLNRLASGDLTTRIADPTDGVSEFQTLFDDFNFLAQKLEGIFATVSMIAQMVLGASRETAAAAMDVAHKAESQSNTVNHSAALLAKVSDSQGETAEMAVKANAAMSASCENMKAGGVMLQAAVEAMQKIELSAGAIKQTIDAIDDIAFQTNLLALNAGVEAARAGDSASGFAVVASEVRGLAQRASASAAEIRRLMSDTERFVLNGSTTMNETCIMLNKLILDSLRTSRIVESITNHSNEQAINMRTLNNGMMALESSAQAFAGSAEETTATSIALRDHVRELNSALSNIKTKNQAELAAMEDWDDNAEEDRIAS
jgi:methyl-accepting chemotaxis protein